MDWEIILVVVLTFLGGAYLYRQRLTKDLVQDIAVETMPLWASFAPFKDGQDSAYVLRYCQWAILGKKFVDDLEKTDTYKKHADSFNRDIDDWGNLVKQSSEVEIADLEAKRRVVTALSELEQMKKEGNLPEWKSYNALGHIISSPENEAAISFYNYLQGLLKTNKDIEEMTSNLIEDYVVYNDTEIDSTMATGLLFYASLRYAKENPNQEISNTIIYLKDKTFEELDVGEVKTNIEESVL